MFTYFNFLAQSHQLASIPNTITQKQESDDESVNYLPIAGISSADINGGPLDEPPSDRVEEDFPCLIGSYDAVLIR